MIRAVAFAIAITCAACSSSAATKPAPGTAPPARSAYDELEARIPKIVAAMDRLATDLTAVADDCSKVASVLRRWGSQYAVELDALWELKTKLTPDEKDRYLLEHDDEAKHVGPVFDAAHGNCTGNQQVEDALTVAGFRRAETAR